MNTSRSSPILIESLGASNLAELADLYFRRCNIMGAKNIDTVAEYLRKNIESKNHLHGYVIRKGGKLVGSSYVARLGEHMGMLLFSVTDESFTGPEMMFAFGRAYRETIKVLAANGIRNIRSVSMEDNADATGYSLATGYIRYARMGSQVYFETYSPLIASVISGLSGVSLDKISLLKLASIAGAPKRRLWAGAERELIESIGKGFVRGQRTG